MALPRLLRPWAFVFVAVASWAQPPVFEGKTLLFGNLHAHSKLSDDIRGAGDDLLPIRAFEYAQAHGLDFLAISDHQQAVDAARPRAFMEPDEYRTKLYEVAMAYNAAQAGKFVAIPAIEWGNGATGNHVNVFGARMLPPDTITNTRYDLLYAWAAANAEFAQFNHPYAWAAEPRRNRQVGNYGEALYGSVADFVRAADPAVQTISIISSVAGGHITGKYADSEQKTHRDRTDKSWQHYLRFLNQGFHLSPAANQDTHGKNWGTVTAARTAVWADGHSYRGVMDAIRQNRVYATEDDELAVVFRVAYRNARHWMGETVGLAAAEEDVVLEFAAWQAKGSDGDSVDEGPYTFSIYVDADGVGGQQATLIDTITGVPANEVRRRSLQVSPGQYVLLEVTEENGKDNAVGEGADELDNVTGEGKPDGKRDDLNDSAWTSPVWFVAKPAGRSTVWVWSKTSALYHDATCWAAKNIGQANRREGTEPPVQLQRHACTPGATP